MTDEDFEERVRQVQAAAAEGDEARAWELLEPLANGWRSDLGAAQQFAAALTLVELARERRLASAQEVLAGCADDVQVVCTLGSAAESFVDLRYLNDAPPEHGFFAALLATLARHFDGAQGEQRLAVGKALAAVARLSGRQADALCDRVHREILRLEPSRWEQHYNHGLFLKTRGRFEEAVAANARAVELGGADDEAAVWNLGICATGAAQGELALRVWREQVGFQGELGDDGLPNGRFHHVKVRVAQRPLAERTAAADSPGNEETLWIERLSPCHGRVLSAPYDDVGVEYGDLVLFDGAPITEHEVDGRQVPVFPHLATLRRSGWKIFPFVGKQQAPRQLASLGEALPGDTVVYAHTEQMRFFCRTCWERGSDSPGHSHTAQEEHAIVSGKFCVDPTVSLAEVDAALSRLLQENPALLLVAPDFARAAGQPRRAEREERLFAQLTEAEEPTRSD